MVPIYISGCNLRKKSFLNKPPAGMVNNSLESIYKKLLNEYDKTWLPAGGNV